MFDVSFRCPSTRNPDISQINGLWHSHKFYLKGNNCSTQYPHPGNRNAGGVAAIKLKYLVMRYLVSVIICIFCLLALTVSSVAGQNIPLQDSTKQRGAKPGVAKQPKARQEETKK